MNKFLKFSLGSFVFILAFAAFAGTVSAEKVVRSAIVGPVPYKEGGYCFSGTFTKWDDGTVSVVKHWEGTMVNGVCTQGGIKKTDPIGDILSEGPASGWVQEGFSSATPVFGNKKNNDVKKIQRILMSEGLISKVDGSFGPQVRTGLKALQVRYNISPTGVFDQATRGLMEQRLNNLGVISTPTSAN